MRNAVLAIIPAFIVCCVDDSQSLLDKRNVSVGLRALQEGPGILPDESITITCKDGVCEQVETVHEVVDPGQDDSPGPHHQNVELQAERESEFGDLTREIIKIADERCGLARTDEDEEIQVAVHLKEQPFDFTRYRGGVSEDVAARRATLNAERRAQLRPSQSATESRVVDHGGIVVYKRFLSNIVDVRLSSCLIADLATWPDVVGLSVPRELQPSGVDGVARRQGVGLPPYGISGLDGSNGSLRSGGTRIRYAVIEAPGTGATNNLNTSHLSFKDGTGSTLRIVDTDRCDFFFPSYQCINTASGTVATHGTTVTSVLLSDLADGQDPGVSGTTDRHKRSGIVPEATVHYYRTSDETSLATAIDEAVGDDGIDIMNMSLSPGSGGFCNNGTQNGVREAIEAATDAGVLAVVAGGNAGLLPPCNINNYATFPDTLAVGGTDDADSLFDLESVERNSQASFGSISVTLRGGAVVQSRIIDVATNFCHTLDAASGTNAYGPGDSCGTSFASPTIAGLAAGLLMHWSFNRGGLGGTLSSDPYSWRTLIALLADGRTSGGTELLNSIGDQLGFGNVRFSNLDTSLGTGTWALSRTTVLSGSQHEFSIGSTAAEPATANGLKFVAIVDDNRYGDSPDITYRLVDKCPPGGGETVLRVSTKHALKGRLRISNGEVNTNLRNRCLWIRTNVNASASSVRLFTAYMLYTTARSGHDASIL